MPFKSSSRPARSHGRRVSTGGQPALAKSSKQLPNRRRTLPGIRASAAPSSSEFAPSVSSEDRSAREGGSTALTIYLRELGQVRLLNADEERKLARRVQRGDLAAREQMIRGNLRLVVRIARDYAGFGLPLLDLINEGNIGLMTAVERFDPTRGAKLSTYASWWIKQSMRRALANQSKTIRLPVHIVEKICHIRRTAYQLHELLGREPDDAEVATEMRIPTREVARVRDVNVRPASLDAPLGDEDASRLADIIRDENAVSPYEQLVEKNAAVMLVELVDQLPPREAEVLRYRFGLDGGKERTLEEVGNKFAVTRERVRQLQNLALAKLRRMIQRLEKAPLLC